MSTEIKVWQINNGKLEENKTSLVGSGRKEAEDLEKWIVSDPNIIGQDILIIGEQVQTRSGVIDFLGIDQLGNLLIIELKRDKIPRVALAQAIDYASDVASWEIEKINELCLKLRNQNLEDYLNENFENIDLEDLAINKAQRILLVGFSIEESLQRMIEWLSNTYNVNVNALLLKYFKTKSEDEMLARTMIIPEEIEKERIRRKQFQILMSDEPGNYEDEELEELLIKYLTEDRKTPKRIKNILIPLGLENDIVTREMIKKSLIKNNETDDEGKAGIIITSISREIGFKNRDYLRQVIQYDRPNPWEKENYKLVEKYKTLLKEILNEINN